MAGLSRRELLLSTLAGAGAVALAGRADAAPEVEVFNAMPHITIPYTPRELQLGIHRGMDAHRFGAVVCHRRFGKTVCAVNHLQKGATTCKLTRPRFAYIGPTYRQAKANAWDYMKFYARPIPGLGVNESELRLDYPNGGQVRIYGADNPDSLRGIYLDGVVFDEYGLQPPNVFTEVVRPALSDRGGWALFLGTPNGKNQFYDAVQMARTDPTWFYGEFKASQTDILTEAELKLAKTVMTPDEYDQEYECSFEASVKGAIWMRELQGVRESGRITSVPYDPDYLVNTDWDLGIGDATAIWFSQSLPNGTIRIIDYYEASGHGLPHFKEVLNRKGYTYGEHWAPHDIEQKEFGLGRSRLETASNLGLHFMVTPKLSVDDGIHDARMILPKCWFDEGKTRAGLEALQNYRWDINTRTQYARRLPLHDWASHGADAFRGLAVRYITPKVKKPAKEKEPAADWYDLIRKANPRRTPSQGRRGGL